MFKEATVLISLLVAVSVAYNPTDNRTDIVRGIMRIPGNNSYPVWLRRPLVLDAPRARYPGFNPSTTILKAGTIWREGAAALTSDILLERDLPVTLRDGTVIYTDVFRPVGNESVPAILVWSPYGKQIGGQCIDDLPERSGVPLRNVSELQKFEGPDPAYWVAHGYAVVNLDARGAYSSQGNISYWGRQTGEDGYDMTEWTAAQSWCTGKIGFAGNSWLAISQWFIAATQPPHLAAIAPWEGASNIYRATNVGGIPSVGFGEAILTTFAGKNYVEDYPRMSYEHPFLDEYWEDKAPVIENITVPAYIVASYTNVVHTLGTFDAWRRVSSEDKWIRIHNTQEWPDFYSHSDDLRSFFDHYLKNKENGWKNTPVVRNTILNPGGEDFVDVPAISWPPPGTVPRTLYLRSNETLAETPFDYQSSYEYQINGTNKKVELWWDIPEDMDYIGYGKVRIWVEARGSDDLDLTVSVEKRSSNGSAFAVPVSAETAATPSASGSMRVSMRHLDSKRSTVYEPYQTFDRVEKLSERQIVQVDIGLWPIGMRLSAGEKLLLTIGAATITPSSLDMGFGVAQVPVPGDGNSFEPDTNVTLIQLGGTVKNAPYVDAQRVRTPESTNKGTHVIHYGGKYKSYLLIPVRPVNSDTACNSTLGS